MKPGRVRNAVKAVEKFSVVAWKIGQDYQDKFQDYQDKFKAFSQVASWFHGYAMAMWDAGEDEAKESAFFLRDLAREVALMTDREAREIVRLPQLPGVGGGL